MKPFEIFLAALGIIVLTAILMAFPTMWLWNWLMPDIFGLPKIHLYQAMGINFLSGILFRTNINVKKN
jgi:hypothetical protein